MPRVEDLYSVPKELVLGARLNARVPVSDQMRQREEVIEILRRLRSQPGVILADEVGMGKTFVALAVAYSVAMRSARGPVIVMVPPNLVDKWEQDLRTFCELYLDGCRAVEREAARAGTNKGFEAFRYGVARHSIDLMKLLDDAPKERCHLILLAQGAMARRQSDKWVRLALIAEALRRHGRGGASRLIQVKKYIHRYLGELVWALGSQRASELGDALWQKLLKTDPGIWRQVHNESVRDSTNHLTDDPIPKSVYRALDDLELKPLAEALKQMPIRASGAKERTSERVAAARSALRAVEEELWKRLLAQARWRSPLLVMDEAHHLKNPGTQMARQLQSPELDRDLRTGDGAMAKAFDRMLFLTATPFQLGHRELVRVLERFGDVRWERQDLGERPYFFDLLRELERRLDESQRAAISLQRSWSRLSSEECGTDVETWWRGVQGPDCKELPYATRSVLDAFRAAKLGRQRSEEALRPWLVRHSKGKQWTGTVIARRLRLDGGAISGGAQGSGLAIPPEQLLPFFLAARSNVRHGQDLLGEALSSSYEAFRETRSGRAPQKDETENPGPIGIDLAHASWFLGEFDLALSGKSGAIHPKIDPTVRRVVDLWESGEKVLVFAFYRLSCRALRAHISAELERRITVAGLRRLRDAGREVSEQELEQLVARIQDRYFDDTDAPGRRAVDSALEEIVDARADLLWAASVGKQDRQTLLGVMRRFLRVNTTIIRCFPLAELDTMAPAEAVARALDSDDRSGLSWRQKLLGFVEFLAESCSTDERSLYLEAAGRTQTGSIRITEDEEEGRPLGSSSKTVLANVQIATGETRRDQRARLMRAFNTPFFPDILVCSEVMGEGVDLQRFCRHVIHHDLAWNPSTIEQRTGRVDRLGCKAEGRHPIEVYLPFLAGTADERQFRVMSERERWFRVVMGEDEVGELIAPDDEVLVGLPDELAEELAFNLSLTAKEVGA